MKRSLIAFGGCGGIEPGLGFVGLFVRFSWKKFAEVVVVFTCFTRAQLVS